MDAEKGGMSGADVAALLKCVGAIYAHANARQFRDALVRALAELVPSETVCLTEIDVDRGRVDVVSDRPMPDLDDHVDALTAYADSHPCIADTFAHPEKGVIAVSDYVSRAEWEERAVYREFYRPGGFPDLDQMSLMLPTTGRPGRYCVGIAFNRRWGRTTARDRAVLHLIRPHIEQGFANAAAVTRLEAQLGGMGVALGAAGGGGGGVEAVEVDAGGVVRWATAGGAGMLGRYFPRGKGAQGLPGELRRWAGRARSRLAAEGGEAGRVVAPYVVRSPGGAVLSIRYVAREDGGAVLVMEERGGEVVAGVRPRLSPRLEQVLEELRSGRSEKEVALRLGLMRNSVHEYVKQVYRAYGVSSRAELMARVLGA